MFRRRTWHTPDVVVCIKIATHSLSPFLALFFSVSFIIIFLMYFISWLPPTHVNRLLAGTDLCQVCTLLCLSCLQDMVGTQILATGMKNKGLSWDLATIVKDTVYLWAPWSLPGHLSHWLPLSNMRQSHDQLHLVKEGSHGGPYWSRAHRVGWGLGALGLMKKPGS